jgi:hypothetical protein
MTLQDGESLFRLAGSDAERQVGWAKSEDGGQQDDKPGKFDIAYPMSAIPTTARTIRSTPPTFFAMLPPFD